MVMDSTGNVILAGGRAVRGRRVAARDPAAAGRHARPRLRRRHGRRRRARSRRPRDQPARPPRRHADVHASAPARPHRPGDLHDRCGCSPTGAPDPTFGGTGVVTVPLGPGSGPGSAPYAVRRGPSTTTLVAGTDLTDRRLAARQRHPAARRRHARHALRQPRDRPRLARRPRHPDHVDGPRQPRPDPARRHRPPAGLAARAPARQRRARHASFGNGGLTYPVLGRPPGGDAGLHHASTRSTPPARARSSSARRPARAGCRAAAAARPTPAASRSRSRNCSDPLVQPRHVRLVLGLHQHAAQHAHAVGVHLDVGVQRQRTRARRSAACSGRPGRGSAIPASSTRALAASISDARARVGKYVTMSSSGSRNSVSASDSAIRSAQARAARTPGGEDRRAGRARAASATAPPPPRRRASTRG